MYLQAQVVVLPPGHGLGVEVVEQVDQIEGHPGRTEYRHHGDQHAVGTALPLPIQLFTTTTSQTDLGLLPAAIGQFERYLVMHKLVCQFKSKKKNIFK